MGRESIHTNDPAVAEIAVKESEYFTKKIGAPLIEGQAPRRQLPIYHRHRHDGLEARPQASHASL
ncbi:hypothetical protein BC936DRAFT_140147 [Jimgerdemannia flammicorona]|uniref:Uncharacterized protein n=1 Tax=Jimgerdemannia flammicorona TaxID=994334 RepID=A0A433AZB6_9FUNG|nr:hypothetical protein BC936DRAFT_140147 [Jimgerdemannia flammicorona]